MYLHSLIFVFNWPKLELAFLFKSFHLAAQNIQKCVRLPPPPPPPAPFQKGLRLIASFTQIDIQVSIGGPGVGSNPGGGGGTDILN